MPGPIVILGVFVADTAYRAERQPKMGETILGTSFVLGPGGKGSNQSVAAARLGAQAITLSVGKLTEQVENVLDLSQSATLRVSDEAANHVLDELRSVGKTHKPQVERANFWVLRSPDVPSMLVETGFITNAEDERKLNELPDDKFLELRRSGGLGLVYLHLVSFANLKHLGDIAVERKAKA